jgi:KipI family sensor histidine kinase inhibitor
MTAIEKINTPEAAASGCVDAGQIRISTMGLGGLLFDPSHGVFDDNMQNRLRGLSLAIASAQQKKQGIRQVILGLNNLLVVFDPLALAPDMVREMLLVQWETAESRPPSSKAFVFEVDYGGAGGEDLVPLAEALGLSVADVVRLHSEATYTVATIGSNPGLAYMSGLSPRLQVKRRATPRLSLPSQTVIIAGTQASVTPMVAPSGWHALGHTDATMFDPFASVPCLLAPGDTVQFKVRKVLS